MPFNTERLFFCSEADYPKFLSLLQGHLPPTYCEFVSRVNNSIKEREEQITVLKVNVGFEDFLAFCRSEGKSPDYESLNLFVFRLWGNLPNA